MAISFSCPSCEGGVKVRDELTGRKVKCPRCSKVIVVPAAAEEPEDQEEQEERPRKKKKKKRQKKSSTALIAGIVIGVLVLVGGGVAIVLAVTGGKKEEQQAKAPPAQGQKAPPQLEQKPRRGGKDLISAVARRLEITEVYNWFKQLGLSYQTVASASTSGNGPSSFKELTELHGTPLKEWLEKNWIIVVWGARPLSQPGGASNTALAWETDADLQGNRVVLMCSGSVETMDEATFAKTAKAMGR
jgi:hypothetical protein